MMWVKSFPILFPKDKRQWVTTLSSYRAGCNCDCPPQFKWQWRLLIPYIKNLAHVSAVVVHKCIDTVDYSFSLDSVLRIRHVGSSVLYHYVRSLTVMISVIRSDKGRSIIIHYWWFHSLPCPQGFWSSSQMRVGIGRPGRAGQGRAEGQGLQIVFFTAMIVWLVVFLLLSPLFCHLCFFWLYLGLWKISWMPSTDGNEFRIEGTHWLVK